MPEIFTSILTGMPKTYLGIFYCFYFLSNEIFIILKQYSTSLNLFWLAWFGHKENNVEKMGNLLKKKQSIEEINCPDIIKK